MWCCFTATYEQALSDAGVGIGDYQYFHGEKGMSLNLKEFISLLNFSTMTCIALPAAGESELRAVSLREGCIFNLSFSKMKLQTPFHFSGNTVFMQLSPGTQPELFLSFFSQEGWATTHQYNDRNRAFVNVDWNMGTMYNSFDHSKTISMKMCHQCLIDIITLNPLVELGSCMSRQTVEWKKDEPVFSDTAFQI